jgi:superfamily II DNA/RNA helicase
LKASGILFSDFDLHPRLVTALDSRKLTKPTEIQEKVIPLILSGSDVLVDAETGSGKTLAYLLPLFQKLMEWQGPHTTAALILVPTRELAQQVHKICEQYTDTTHTKSITLTGGQEFRFQAALLRKTPEILVATPGRLKELIENDQAELGDIDYLVLDEADRMLDMGFREDVMQLVEACPQERQTLLLSATLKHSGVSTFAKEILKEPAKVGLSASRSVQESIQHQIILSDDQEHKLKLVNAILAEQGKDSSHSKGKILIFANKRLRVDKICELLSSDYRVNKLHGEMTQDERNRVMSLYRSGAVEILVATDLAARGLDVEDVSLVINFDMAHSGNDYIHRVGRTGRAGNQGTAISLIAAYEWNLSESIQRYLNSKFEPVTVKGLKGKFKGPKKVSKKKAKKASAVAKKAEGKHSVYGTYTKEKDKPKKIKVRKRDQKNIGKRRKPSGAKVIGDGSAPLKR